MSHEHQIDKVSLPIGADQGEALIQAVKHADQRSLEGWELVTIQQFIEPPRVMGMPPTAGWAIVFRRLKRVNLYNPAGQPVPAGNWTMPANTFAVGDVVFLKSGGPPMTVSEIGGGGPPMTVSEIGGSDPATHWCVWFGPDGRDTGRFFRPECLVAGVLDDPLTTAFKNNPWLSKEARGQLLAKAAAAGGQLVVLCKTCGHSPDSHFHCKECPAGREEVRPDLTAGQ